MANLLTACRACGEPADNCGIPVDTTGRIVHVGYTGEWVGAPACRGCYEVHAAGGPEALDAHVKATRRLRARLTRSRNAVKALRVAAQRLADAIGGDV
jgi:hypothetical protein